ncbi:hypothetical protein J2X84_002610 [Pseudomonas corrugata]|uniref:hypothetical protein n=1 Tax=Pseudomonas corrugata TaxID=47879 RepID=UPI00285AD5F7|nr:hypothetical protein [Pseudomonas corrugata]MDR7283781.1 hypothetical protein [Pseudomonas corrugata]
MMTIKLTSLLLAGLLCAASATTFAMSNDGADATGTQSGATSAPTPPPDNTPGTPSAGNNSDSGGGTGTNGGVNSSGSGTGGGTGPAGGGTGSAGGGTGS